MFDLNTLTDAAGKALDRFRLDNKKAIVVGGNKGLGQAMSLALAAAGADVCVVGRGPDGLEETVTSVEKLGRKGFYFAADVSDEVQVEKLVAFAKEKMGSIDILVNSQGIVHLQPATVFDTEAWQRVMDVNIKSIMLTCKHVGKQMLQQGKGKVVNISSVRAFQGRACDLAYAPSKGAVNQMTRSLAIEWGEKGINVNGIAPVFTKTALNEELLKDPIASAWVLSRIPMKRLGELDDIFGAIIFLASEASNFVNGHTLPVDGGWLCA